MLAPIITKDMKLFPSRPLPAGIKNVRSRAQSLDQFTNVQNSGTARGRIVPVKPRNSVSTGNLPTVARSPPTQSARKTTLSAIQEGVELSSLKENDPQSSTSSCSEPSLRNGTTPGKKMTATQAARIIASKQKTSSGSDDSDDGDRKERKKTKKRSVVKWLTSAFRKNSKEEDLSPERMSTISS